MALCLNLNGSLVKESPGKIGLEENPLKYPVIELMVAQGKAKKYEERL